MCASQVRSVLTAIAELDWARIHAAGVRYLVVDKDNCITKPHDTRLEPSLSDAWADAKRVFGADNILIVSNSAGTRRDPLGVGAENVSSSLGVPVLLHAAPKPATGCARAIIEYAATQAPYMQADNAPSRVLVIGDRLLTDTALAHRIGALLARHYARTAAVDSHRGVTYCFSVLTTHRWAPERGLGALFGHWERVASDTLVRRGIAPGGSWRSQAYEALPFVASPKLAPAPAPAPAVRAPQTLEMLGRSLVYGTAFRALPRPLQKLCEWIAALGRRIANVPGVAARLSDTRDIISSAGSAVRSSVNACSMFPRTQKKGPFGRRSMHTMRSVHSAPARKSTGALWRRIAVVALMAIVMPVGFYGGMLLNEYVEMRSAGDLSHEGEKRPAEAAASSKQAAPPAGMPAADKLSEAEIHRKLQGLELDHYHRRHELESVRSKLARVEARHG